MYLAPVLRRAILIGAAVLIGVVALIALTRNRAPVPAAGTAALAGNPEPVAATPNPTPAFDAYGQPINPDATAPSRYAQPAHSAQPPAVYGALPFSPSEPAPPLREAAAPAPVAPPVAETAMAPVQAAAPAPLVQQRSRAYRGRTYRRRTVVVVKRRPFRRSAEIVAGSAAGGALIGGLAGGGKGAGIGALAAGAGGLIYDRATHKKRVVVSR